MACFSSDVQFHLTEKPLKDVLLVVVMAKGVVKESGKLQVGVKSDQNHQRCLSETA